MQRAAALMQSRATLYADTPSLLLLLADLVAHLGRRHGCYVLVSVEINAEGLRGACFERSDLSVCVTYL